jgi:hypothetical protein
VVSASQRAQRPGKARSVLLDWTVAYGYCTWKAAFRLIGLLIARSVAFQAAHDRQQLTAAHTGQEQPGIEPLVALRALDARVDRKRIRPTGLPDPPTRSGPSDERATSLPEVLLMNARLVGCPEDGHGEVATLGSQRGLRHGDDRLPAP